jgi:hypothetical protein
MHEGGDRIHGARVMPASATEGGLADLTAPDEEVRRQFEQLISAENLEVQTSAKPAEPAEPAEAAEAVSATGLQQAPLLSAHGQPLEPGQQVVSARRQRLSDPGEQRLGAMPSSAVMWVGAPTRPDALPAATSSPDQGVLPVRESVGPVLHESSPASWPAGRGIPAATLSQANRASGHHGPDTVESPVRGAAGDAIALVSQSPPPTHPDQSAPISTPVLPDDAGAPVAGAVAMAAPERDELESDGSDPLALAASAAQPVALPLMTPVLQELAPGMTEKTLSLTPGALTDWLQQTVADLKVFKGDSGMSQIHLDIKPELLPGVRVILQEAGGRIQVDFICTVESSRRVLGAVAQREANEMAKRCRRDLLLRVCSDEDELDPRTRNADDLVEIVAAA